MPSYMVLWHANPTEWSTDPKQKLQGLEAATAGGDMLLQSGRARELSYFGAESGYAICDADSKAAVLSIVQPFFPTFSQEILEIVPWAEGCEALLDSARAMAGG